MFGLGRRKQVATIAPSRLFELTFFPDGEIIDGGWNDVSAGGFGKPDDGKVEGTFTIAGVACRLDATLNNRNAIFSMWADGKIVTSSLLLGSDDAAFNARLTTMYLDSARNTTLVKELTQGREVFTDVERCSERPLLATMLMPAPSREVTDGLRDVQRSWAAAVLG